MVLGTTSDAGKTVITTGLCRALSRRGLRVAPFKAQNMSNNSMVTADGAEIGRAQWIQAVAARSEPEAAMNPVLLKPGSDLRSHVVVMGRPAGTLDAGEFAGGRAALARAAYDAFDDLAGRYDVVVCEGAGSPAEINLRAHDYVNLGLARHASIPSVLVGDIDRGGVFAAMHGTLALLDEADQALVCGLVVNRFRGDVGLLRPGLHDVARLTHRPVLGVVPWLSGLWLDSEDSLSVRDRPAPRRGTRPLRVAVVRLPRISNFTDVDALCLEPGLDVAFTDDALDVRSADVVVVPGTRATIADLAWLRELGLADAVCEHAARGGAVLGICGGFQMLGREVSDPDGVEGDPAARAPGLGLLDVTTTFGSDKVLGTPSGTARGVPISGYEIHHGRVHVGTGEAFPGGVRSGAVVGTMWHACLEGDRFRAAWLREAAGAAGHELPDVGKTSFATAREARIDAIADAVEEHLDLDAVLRLVELGPTPGLPPVRGGLVP
ncbi:cobyric acid synthase [Nocardioides sp. GXQ0305]|uniref:cobyric acid synthase n=1 Tax=Nocardioides sp. GXQ0305 TaxID=3423912 RepID=UPI003D7E5488